MMDPGWGMLDDGRMDDRWKDGWGWGDDGMNDGWMTHVWMMTDG